MSDGSQAHAESTTDLLIRAGYIRQTHAGIFQLLPLGCRVQERIEQRLDRHMRELGASKVSLSTFSSEKLWAQSGRLAGDNRELFKLQDRRGTPLLLSPTHEEEITSLVSGVVHSYRNLPLRLYQVTRKYRDERRARAGLLRTREFVMKDLYTFDATEEQAMVTYNHVRKVYSALFKELKVPMRVAVADSGSIGGDVSHEYHLLSPAGEDELVTCSQCSWSANMEVLAERKVPAKCPRCHSSSTASSRSTISDSPTSTTLRVEKAIELGHTFFLGTKYSGALNAHITNAGGQRAPLQMGCYGIGVSRMVAGLAHVLRSSTGLNWPRGLAPFDAVIIAESDFEHDARKLYRALCNLPLSLSGARGFAPILDDRDHPTVHKLKDADLIGYSIILVLGKAWRLDRVVEIQCHRLGVRKNVTRRDLKAEIAMLWAKL